jgi:hypothetical protein
MARGLIHHFVLARISLEVNVATATVGCYLVQRDTTLVLSTFSLLHEAGTLSKYDSVRVDACSSAVQRVPSLPGAPG